MRLTMKERTAVTAVTAVMRARYQRASKKQRGHLLDELVVLTRYNRCYAVGLLRSAPLRGRERRRTPRPPPAPR